MRRIIKRLALPICLFLILLVVGCNQATPDPAGEATSTPATGDPAEPTDPAPTQQPTTPADDTNTPEPEPTDTPTKAAATSTQILDDQVDQLLTEFIDPDGQVGESLATILESGDQRFVAVLLELLRARQIGIVGGPYGDYIAALEELSGQEFGEDWPAWIEWYGATDLEPPPGFTTWKGQVLSRIDPGFADFLRSEYPSRIRTEEILWGGVPIDGIPPLENAPMIPGDEADYLVPEEPVFGLLINGEARAYPLRIVDNHEMANDVIGGVPVSIAYCTLCGAAIAYDGRGPDGETNTFGTSGFLYRSNKLMYDRPTRTLWNQLTGEPVLGELADSDIQLEFFPIVLSAWSDWLAKHPDTLVLDRDTGVYPPDLYESGILYGDYFSSSGTMFPVWQRSGLMAPKDFVYALHLDGVPKAYDVKALAAEQVVNDTIGQNPVVLVAPNDPITVSGNNRRAGPVIYTNGAEVRAFDRGDETFTPGPDPNTLLDSSGRSWLVTEEALLGPSGQTAPRINGHLAYWFGWYAFFPETALYQAN